MPRKTDLEQHIRESYQLIHEFEDILRLSDNPKEKARARRASEEQWEFIKRYLGEYAPLCERLNLAVPGDIAEIAVIAGISLLSASLTQPPSGPTLTPTAAGPRDSLTDAFTPHETGLTRLLEHLGKDHPSYAKGLTFQTRLLENIAQVRTYGDSENLRSERNRILMQLNRLALETIGKSFNQLCGFSGEGSNDLQQMMSRLHGATEDLQSICDFLRGSQDFPSKQVIDNLFLVLGRVVQLSEGMGEWSGARELSSELHIKELLQRVDHQLRYCRTQTRFLSLFSTLDPGVRQHKAKP